MSILGFKTLTTGLADSPTNLIYFKTDDTLAEVTATGYLNDYAEEISIYNMAMIYTTDEGTILLQVVQSGLNWSLQSPSVAMSGNLTVNGNVNALGNLVAGASGTAGSVSSFPATASKGSLVLQAVANTGDTLVTVSNALHGQASVYTIPDVGAATGGLLVSTTPLRSKYVVAAAAAGGAAAQSFSDAFCTSASHVVGNWVTQANAASVLTITPGNGSFIVTSSANAGVGTFSYTITKA